jgi:hypothetical protein
MKIKKYYFGMYYNNLGIDFYYYIIRSKIIINIYYKSTYYNFNVNLF